VLVKLEFIAVVSTRLPRRGMGGRRRREHPSRPAATGGGVYRPEDLLGARFDLLACSTKPAIENTRSHCALVALIARTASMGVFSAGGSTMTATNHDDQRLNLVKFIQRCQMSLTLVKRLYSYRQVAPQSKIAGKHCTH